MENKFKELKIKMKEKGFYEKFKSIDFYKKLPNNLTEPTLSGAASMNFPSFK